MMTDCPECGRRHVVMWPELNPFRRGDKFYCCHECWETSVRRDMKQIKDIARKRRMKKMNGKLKPEQEQEAIRLATAGESPLPFLKKCGMKNPSASWAYIKKKMKEKDPEQMAKVDVRLPKTGALSLGKDETPTIKLDGAIRIETPETNRVEVVETPEKKPDNGLKKPLDKIVGPCHIDKFMITAIRTKDLGEFYYDKKFQKLDWRTPEGDEISMSPAGWDSLLKDLPHVLRILGVEM